MTIRKPRSKGADRRWRQRLIRYAADLHFAPNTIERFIELSEGSVVEEQDSFERRFERASPAEFEWLEDYAGDHAQELRDVTDLTYELAILALHKAVEISARNMVGHAYPGFPLHKVFNAKQFTEELALRRFSLASTPRFRSFDELRCISNAIKHNGKVDAKLAAFGRWRFRKGKPLGNLKPHFERLLPLARQYVAHLARRFSRQAS